MLRGESRNREDRRKVSSRCAEGAAEALLRWRPPSEFFFATAFYDTWREDISSHTVCAVMDRCILWVLPSLAATIFSAPGPGFDFPALEPGDRM